MLRERRHIHLVGIGGVGLSAIARVLLGMGHRVTGSDQQANDLTAALAAEGAQVFIGHDAAHIAGADMLLVSSAIPESNPELVAAREASIPVLKRNEFLGAPLAGHRGIAIAGTHGKTTTTAMLTAVLVAAGLDPSFIVGGVLADYNTNARAGRGDLFVIEADEYDRMFLGLYPQAEVLTVVEHDHPDCYPTEADMLDAYRQFVGHLPADGLLVACRDDRNARLLGEERAAGGGAVAWFGLQPGAEWQASEIRPNQLGGNDFVALRNGQTFGLFRLRLPGRHNVLNALAVLVVADWLNVPLSATRTALGDFHGVGRRFELKGSAAGVVVIDDYAHHPTEIRATLAAARERFAGRKLWVVFQPHTYSRTRTLLDEFAAAFKGADEVIVLDIYAARERDTHNVSAADLAGRIKRPRAWHIGDRYQAAAFLADNLETGDVLITLGAGDGYVVGEWVLDALRSQSEEE